MSTTPTERRLAITPDPMTTDKNKVSELLVSNLIWQMRDAHGRAPVVLDKQLAQAQGAAEDMEAELSRLRQERDELVGALEATWSALEASPCDPDITADQIAAHAELKKHDVMALLSKHKPE